MKQAPRGPQNPRRSPEQTRAAQKKRDILQQMKDEEMDRKMREAYEKAQSRSVSGMKKGGEVEEDEDDGRTRGGPTSREATGPTSGRATYIPNPFGKSKKVYLGPTGGRQPKVATRNKYDIFGNENPNYNRKLADAEEERKRGTVKMAEAGEGRKRATAKMAAGGSVSSASKRADGCATKGKTRGKFV